MDTKDRLEVLDVTGRLVTTLVESPQPSGDHQVVWDACVSGRRVRPGVYFARLSAGSRSSRCKVTIIR